MLSNFDLNQLLLLCGSTTGLVVLYFLLTFADAWVQANVKDPAIKQYFHIAAQAAEQRARAGLIPTTAGAKKADATHTVVTKFKGLDATHVSAGIEAAVHEINRWETGSDIFQHVTPAPATAVVETVAPLAPQLEVSKAA